jgi:CBS domain containing-hemolysin-like protein
LVILFGIIFVIMSLLRACLRSLSTVTLRRLGSTSENSFSRQVLERYLEDPAEVVIHLSVVMYGSVLAMAAVAASTLRSGSSVAYILLLFGVLFVFIGVADSLILRLVPEVNTEGWLLALLPAYRILSFFIKAIAYPFFLLGKLLPKASVKEDTEEATDEDVEAFIDAGEEAGILEESEAELVQSVVEFGDTIVREVMVPRTEMVCVQQNATIEELRQLIIDKKYSRIPVYSENLDRIEGVAYLKDLLEHCGADSSAVPVKEIMKPALFVPETKKVSQLLKEFQKKHTQIAIVLDEYGGTEGLVTLEDLLEEIVGDIRDEHDEEMQDIIDEGNGKYLMKASVDVEELKNLFDVEVERRDFDTLAGFVFMALGRIPKPGEKLTTHGLSIEILEAGKRKIEKVRVYKV